MDGRQASAGAAEPVGPPLVPKDVAAEAAVWITRLHGGQRIITLRCKAKKCIPGFLFQALLGPELQGMIEFHSTGSTAKGIKSAVFVTLSFRLPMIAEQQRIASLLSCIDARITAEAQKLESLKTHKKGLMQRLFPSPSAAEA